MNEEELQGKKTTLPRGNYEMFVNSAGIIQKIQPLNIKENHEDNAELKEQILELQEQVQQLETKINSLQHQIPKQQQIQEKIEIQERISTIRQSMHELDLMLKDLKITELEEKYDKNIKLIEYEDQFGNPETYKQKLKATVYGSWHIIKEFKHLKNRITTQLEILQNQIIQLEKITQ